MLNIVTALKIEAKPIIDHFNLKLSDGIYQNENINLIITGAGKIKSAINTALLLSKQKNPILNIGIAGSDKYEVGSGFFIHKITDFDTGYNYYPDFFTKPSEEIVCMSKPGKYFNLVDMESSAFFEASYKFLNVNEIILYKIVSDTPSHKPDKAKIPNLVKEHITIIEEIIEKFNKKEDFFEEIENTLNEAKEKMKLTKTQENQLKKILITYKIKNRPLPSFYEMKKKEEVKEFITSLFSSLEI